jgi:acyl-CoA synthetase (AMP-forming)/AMP-acid ligase II
MQRFELEPFCRIIQDQRITFAFVVPPVVLALAKHPLIDKYNLSSLRMMHSSAAPLTDDLVQMVYKRLKVPIKQGYGLSEASPGVATQVREKSAIFHCSC